VIEYFSTIVGSTNPAYFYGDGKEDFVVAESIEAALELAKVKLLTSHFSLLTLDKMLMH
jgi:valyl-tRNA synthetase